MTGELVQRRVGGLGVSIVSVDLTLGGARGHRLAVGPSGPDGFMRLRDGFESTDVGANWTAVNESRAMGDDGDVRGGGILRRLSRP